MKIWKYPHACVLLEEAGSKILFDPGTFTFKEGLVRPEDFRDISAVFVTHNHQDHYFPAALKIILAQNVGARIVTNPMTAASLLKEGIVSEAFVSGELELGPIRVTAIPATHEKILYSIPENTAFSVNDIFLHPGDSFDASMYGIKPKVLALPTWAPWMTYPMALEFVKGVLPKRVIPIHDWPVREEWRIRSHEMFGEVLEKEGVAFQSLSLGEVLEI